MTFNEYQRGVMRTASDVTKATKENMLMNGILGAAGEAGELVDLLKKQIFQGHPFDREHLIKECGDVLYYLALTAEALDTSLEDIAIKNNKKLWNAILTASKLKIHSTERKGIFNVCSYSPCSGISFQHLYAD